MTEEWKHHREVDQRLKELALEQKFQNELLVGAYAAIDYLAEIVVNLNKRIKKLE